MQETVLEKKRKEFCDILDNVMLECMHKRIVLYGFNYGGRYVKWYAKYYHGIDVDYIISTDMRPSQSYEEELFRPSLLTFEYKDVKNAVIWCAEYLEQKQIKELEQLGYKENDNLYDLYRMIYCNNKGHSIQFLSFLESECGCDFLTAIESGSFKQKDVEGHSYRVTTEKEIFPILDRIHCKPRDHDAFFDYGCGKGGSMVSFFEYGFDRVGGWNISRTSSILLRVIKKY